MTFSIYEYAYDNKLLRECLIYLKFQKILREFWEDRNGPVVFTTVSKNSVPNSIYTTCVSMEDDSTILIADNYFDKTERNLEETDKESILFITNSSKSIQFKGKTEYETTGQYFDKIKNGILRSIPVKGLLSLRLMRYTQEQAS